jgi:hypothetical protein
VKAAFPNIAIIARPVLASVMLFACGGRTESIVGLWACHQLHVPRNPQDVEHYDYRSDGLVNWHLNSYHLTSHYEFDGRILTIYGQHLPGVLKWKVKFESADAYTATPIQGEIVGESCARETSP